MSTFNAALKEGGMCPGWEMFEACKMVLMITTQVS